MKLKKYSLEQLKEAIATSNSYRMALQKLDVADYGGNYSVIQKACRFFEIDTSHFRGKGWSKGQSLPKAPLQSFFDSTEKVNTYKFRLRLVEEKIFEHKCTWCQNTEWRGQPVPLELDHIDGNPRHNKLENLRVLCPNCHAQTPTHRGKNKKK